MGLDMRAIIRTEDNELIEIAAWRKHPNLHGWFQKLYALRSGVEDAFDFNCVELELFQEDIAQLYQDVIKHKLPPTDGFFFGKDSDEHYYENDLAFIRHAFRAFDNGSKVFYNSSW